MRTGVKYCGGCNPHYDREKEVKLLKQRLSELKGLQSREKVQLNDSFKGTPDEQKQLDRAETEISTVRDEIEYDKILLVCGCPRVCLKKYRDQDPEKYILLQRRRDFDNLENRLINKKRN